MKTGRTFVAFGLVLVALMCGCQKQTPKETITTTTTTSPAAGTLTFDDGCVSWITGTNQFAQANRPAVSKWFGVVYQFGAFTGGETFEGEVVFTSPTGSPITTTPLTAAGTLAATGFTWINIVSPRAGAAAPMLPVDAYALFPNTHTATVCDMGSSGDNCRRDRRLHFDQPHIDFIITYWEGANGFEVVSKPNGEESKVTFKFMDNFEVDVYKMNETAGTMDLVMHLNPGVAGAIEVKDSGGGTHGGRHDPPWNIGTPP